MSALFDCLNAINYKNKSYKYKKKDCSGYMLLLWFSHDRYCLSLLDDINEHLFDMPDAMVYKYLYDAVPHTKRFLKWDKGTKQKKMLVKEEKIIKKMMDTYGFSRYEAETLYILYIKEN